ncbi:ATP-citrate synthase alpha chain protein 3 [Camellia lanceoleosa]|uniref:ATP-citrate synthase alpha chain protein 3 n=1 Tax=Camellia lanceoleosa TaxID=1840588 RepID=A0ACC0I676_9ERIC|nr:ATP-citrate synthase alpha chain protein 3 [Camellia lanceoleosa]
MFIFELWQEYYLSFVSGRLGCTISFSECGVIPKWGKSIWNPLNVGSILVSSPAQPHDKAQPNHSKYFSSQFFVVYQLQCRSLQSYSGLRIYYDQRFSDRLIGKLQPESQ